MQNYTAGDPVGRGEPEPAVPPATGRSRLGAHALFGMTTSVARKGLLLVYNILFVRLLGTQAYAVYVASDTVLRPLALVASLGGPNLTLKETASAWALGDRERAGRYLGAAIAAVVGLSIVCTIAVGVLAVPLARALGDMPYLSAVFRTFGWVVLPLAMLTMLSGALTGLGRTTTNFSINNLVVPGIRILVLGALAIAVAMGGVERWWQGWVPEAVAAVVMCVVAGYMVYRLVGARGITGGGVARAVPGVLVAAGPLIVHGLANQSFHQVDRMMIAAIVRDPAALAGYSVAVGLAGMLPLFHRNIVTAVAPAISAAFARGDRPAALRLYRTSAELSFSLAALTYLLLLLLGPEILGLYGPQYRAGVAILAVAAWGDLIDTYAGCGGYLLIARDRGRLLMYNAIGTTLLNIALSVALVLRFGVMGAAAAAAIAVAAKNLIIIIQNYQIDGMHPLTPTHITTLLFSVALTGAVLLFDIHTAPLAMRAAAAVVLGGAGAAWTYFRFKPRLAQLRRNRRPQG